MADAENLTPEERAILDRLKASEREAESLPPPSEAFQAKVADETATHAALAADSSVHDRVAAMSQDELEEAFGDALNAGAYDGDEGVDPEPGAG